MKKWLKIIALVTTVSLLLLSFAGCGGKKELGSKVDKEKLPKGVIQVNTPCPDKALLVGELFTQEAVRRYVVANTYTQAVLHYDFKKGNAKDFSKLVDKMKKAWLNGKNAATYALYYNTRLAEMSRRSNYKRYAVLEKNGIQFISTAMAAGQTVQGYDKNKIKITDNPKSKEEIYAKDNKAAIKKFIDAYPEEKQLLGLTQVLDTNFSTACSIMKDIYPDRIGGGEGRSWEDIGADVLYRSANVAKTAGKAAGIGIAVLTMPATGGASTALCAGAGLVKIADTSLDAAQTAHVLVTGEELDLLNKGLKVTEAADAVCGVLTFTIKSGAIKKSLYEGSADLAKMAVTGNPDNIVKAFQAGTLASVGGTAYGLCTAEAGDNAYMVMKEFIGEAGRQLRLTSVPANELNTPENRKKLEAMDLTVEEVTQSLQAEQEKAALRDTASAEDYVKAAEEIKNAGDGAKFGEDYDKAMAVGAKALATAFGVDGDALAAVLQKLAVAEINETAVIVVDDGQQNGAASPQGFTLHGNGTITPKTAPYAMENVTGEYTVSHNNGIAHVTVSKRDGRLYAKYRWKHNKHNTTDTTEGHIEDYDENTGIGIFRGVFFNCRFKFTGNKGLSILEELK